MIFFQGKHNNNRLKHLKNKHAKELEEEFTKYKGEKKTKDRNTPKFVQSSLKKRKISVEISEQDIIDAGVDLVTMDGRPFSAVEDEGFQKLCRPILEALNSKTKINRHNVPDYVTKEAKKIRSQIKKEVENKMVSVKIDIATYLDRSFLGINIQFLNLDRKLPSIEIRTIAVKELNESHTAQYIKSVLLEELKKVDISPSQIYSITTDNGANVIKCAKLLNNLMKNDSSADLDINSEEEIDDEDQDDEPDDVEIEDDGGTENDVDYNEDAILNENNDSENSPEENIQGIIEGISFQESKNIVVSIRCFAHTLQLVVKWAFLMPYKQFLAKVKRAVKQLRNPTVRLELQKKGLKLAVTDTETRWMSSFNMLKRLLELKDFCEEKKNKYRALRLTKTQWVKIEQLVSTLEPTYITTKILQGEQLTLTDAYKFWTNCEIQTGKMGNYNFLK